MLMGCQNSTRLSKVEVPANLMQPCAELQEVQGTTGKDFMLWGLDTIAKYNDCAAKNDAWIGIGKALK